MTALLKLLKEDKNSVIRQTIEVLKDGGLVIFPSDTVYGILVDATSEKAVEKLIAFKNRPPGKAISVFISDLEALAQTVTIEKKESLLKTLLPGPFTIILPSRHVVSKKLESEKGTLGVRFPDYAFVNQLVKKYGKPITATSANLGGRHPHYSIESLLNQLPKHKQELIDLIVDAGKLPRNKPSTVIDLTSETMKILRQGDIVLSDSETYKSESPTQTKKVGSYIADLLVKKHGGKPVIYILKGDLGTGKTQMVKGIAEHFGITNIISPTFVVSYEYEIISNYEIPITNYERFIHVDLYNIENPEEFKHLGLEEYLKEGSMMCIEWGEKLGDLYEKLAAKANIVYIEIEYETEKKRKIIVKS